MRIRTIIGSIFLALVVFPGLSSTIENDHVKDICQQFFVKHRDIFNDVTVSKKFISVNFLLCRDFLKTILTDIRSVTPEERKAVIGLIMNLKQLVACGKQVLLIDESNTEALSVLQLQVLQQLMQLGITVQMLSERLSADPEFQKLKQFSVDEYLISLCQEPTQEAINSIRQSIK